MKESRPSRARGLKPVLALLPVPCKFPSRPSRARGLKPQSERLSKTLTSVAPLAGAWIETPKNGKSEVGKKVAPLAGAWIETLGMIADFPAHVVAPLAGAWIETSITQP